MVYAYVHEANGKLKTYSIISVYYSVENINISSLVASDEIQNLMSLKSSLDDISQADFYKNADFLLRTYSVPTCFVRRTGNHLGDHTSQELHQSDIQRQTILQNFFDL